MINDNDEEGEDDSEFDGDDDNVHCKEHVIKPPCETNTIHCYGDNNTTTMATKICNMTGDPDSDDFCHVLGNANKWSEEYCLTQVTGMIG